MPLPYTVEADLDIRGSAFNADGFAIIDLRAGRYGGDWAINAIPRTQEPDPEPCGKIWTTYERADLTKDPHYPDLAMDSALVWINDQTKQRGWRMLEFQNLNSQIPEDERPHFAAAVAVIGNESFVPTPGVVYADERTY